MKILVTGAAGFIGSALSIRLLELGEQVIGIDNANNIHKVNIYPKNTKGLNLGFDITPANLVSGFITEKGVFKPEDIKKIL